MSGDTYLPLVGGAEVHVFELQKRLRALGHEVTLFVTDPKSAVEDVQYPVLRDTWSLKRAPAMLKRIWQHSADVELFHVHNPYRLGVLVGLVARLRRKPCIMTLHGLGLLDIPDNPWFYTQVHKLYRTLSLWFATQVISTSEDLAQVCQRYSSRPMTLIPNGLDTQAFAEDRVVAATDARFDDAHPMILTVRRLVPKNGIHYIISALPCILKRFPQAKLVMIGDGRMRESLEARAKSLGVFEACLFLGALPNVQVPQIAKRADVVVFPSTAESTSIACAEMMAMGKKVVASRVGGLIELLGKNEERGWLVKIVPWESCDYTAPDELPMDRYQALAERVCDALEERAHERCERARVYACEQLDWGIVVAKTVEVYKRSLSLL